MGTYTIGKNYRFACADGWCDCGGVHYADSMAEALEGARDGYDSIVEVYSVQSNDGVIADCYSMDSAKAIRTLLNKVTK